MVKVGDRKCHELNIKATEVKRKFPTKLQNKQCVCVVQVLPTCGEQMSLKGY